MVRRSSIPGPHAASDSLNGNGRTVQTGPPAPSVRTNETVRNCGHPRRKTSLTPKETRTVVTFPKTVRRVGSGGCDQPAEVDRQTFGPCQSHSGSRAAPGDEIGKGCG